jgi:hypothetical protein
VLPDLVALKVDIQFRITSYLRNAIRARQGVFAQAPRYTLHEGTSTRTIRADSSVEDTELKEASAEMSIPFEEIPRMTPASMQKKLDEIAEKMAGQMVGHMFESLNTTLDKAGQTIDAKGKGLTTELFFELLEKVEVQFDEDGEVEDGHRFVVGPQLLPQVQKLQEEAERNPEVKRRHEEILKKKWLEWRDREAARKLVG